VVGVVVAQLLAFFRCLEDGFRQIHHHREGLSTDWWENSRCAHFPEGVRRRGDFACWTNEPKESLESNPSSGKIPIESSLAKIPLRGDPDAMDTPVFIPRA